MQLAGRNFTPNPIFSNILIISTGNLENRIAKYEGLLEHMRTVIGELCAGEDRVRLIILQLLRCHQWGSGMKMGTLGQLIYDSFMEESVQIAATVANQSIKGLKRYLNNPKTMVRNNYTRVLAKRIRPLLDVCEAYKC
jgi:hypothetical protein